MAVAKITRWRVITVAAAVSAVVSVTPAHTSEPISPIEVSVCQLALHGDRYDGKLIRVTARPEMGVEFIRLYSRNCPNSSLFVGHAAVDVSGCEDHTVAEKYGCPLNSDTGVRVTLTGTFRFKNFSHARSVGSIDVTAVVYEPGEFIERSHGT